MKTVEALEEKNVSRIRIGCLYMLEIYKEDQGYELLKHYLYNVLNLNYEDIKNGYNVSLFYGREKLNIKIKPRERFFNFDMEYSVSEKTEENPYCYVGTEMKAQIDIRILKEELKK